MVLAAPCGTIGGFLYARGYIRTGWTFIGIALLIVAVAVVSFAVPPLLLILVWASAPLRWLSNVIWQFVGRTFSRTTQRVRSYFSQGVAMYDFVAETPRAYMHSQQADYKLIPKPEGSQFRGVGFVVRPDYRLAYWRAGFRLVRPGEDLSQGDIGDTVLFHIAFNQWGTQPTVALIIRRQVAEQNGLTFHNARWPSFRISANVWSVPNSSRLRIAVMVEAPGSSPVEAEFDSVDMESVALVAWGDGNPFRVFFDDVKVYWR